MPSERYFKLSDDKQQRIVEASMDEFIEAGMHDASINKIIKDADISRGSFYTYFIDKTDLFEYIFGMLKKSAVRSILDEVDNQNGDIFRAARQLVMQGAGMAARPKDKATVLFDKIMQDFGIIAHISEIPMGQASTLFGDLLREIYSRMDDLRNHIPEDQFYIVGDMMIVTSVKSLVAIRRNPEKKELILDMLFRQYDIMEKGIKEGALK
ncbi:MAG: TetR/AcrR family transcriptional regulator [Lachnospiraceae bacterium]|nr:TetR/AcrR family transcriptional regulator [Lachnospiraceae bacterium]